MLRPDLHPSHLQSPYKPKQEGTGSPLARNAALFTSPGPQLTPQCILSLSKGHRWVDFLMPESQNSWVLFKEVLFKEKSLPNPAAEICTWTRMDTPPENGASLSPAELVR